jgi:hypothetical protein
MNTQKIASELINIAKHITAKEYPPLISAKGKEFYDILRDGIKRKEVWNTDLKRASSILERDFDNAINQIHEALPFVEQNIFNKGGVDFRFFRIISKIPKYIRDMKKFLQSKGKGITPPSQDYIDRFDSDTQEEIIREQSEMEDVIRNNWNMIQQSGEGIIEFMESWYSFLEMKKAAKKFLQKGRKPSPNAKPSLDKGGVSAGSIAYINKALSATMKKMKAKFVSSETKIIIKIARDYLKEHDVSKSIDKELKSQSDKGRRILIRQIIEDQDNSHSLDENKRWKYRLKKNAASIAKEMSERSFDRMSEKFIHKNISKIAPLFQKKKVKVKEITILPISFVDGNLEGGLSVVFNDGSGFDANTIVVRVSGFPPYWRFPTRFQNVIFPDGTKKRGVPERAMHDKWLNS